MGRAEPYTDENTKESTMEQTTEVINKSQSKTAGFGKALYCTTVKHGVSLSADGFPGAELNRFIGQGL